MRAHSTPGSRERRWEMTAQRRSETPEPPSDEWVPPPHTPCPSTSPGLMVEQPRTFILHAPGKDVKFLSFQAPSLDHRSCPGLTQPIWRGQLRMFPVNTLRPTCLPRAAVKTACTLRKPTEQGTRSPGALQVLRCPTATCPAARLPLRTRSVPRPPAASLWWAWALGQGPRGAQRQGFPQRAPQLPPGAGAETQRQCPIWRACLPPCVAASTSALTLAPSPALTVTPLMIPATRPLWTGTLLRGRRRPPAGRSSPR